MHSISTPISALNQRAATTPPRTEEIARFETRWRVGSRERLAFDLLLYTGLRRGDVARLGRQHVRDGVITLRTDKTGQVVTLPILPPARREHRSVTDGRSRFHRRRQRPPDGQEGLRQLVSRDLQQGRRAGSARSLRKLGATRAADNGATEAQLEAIFGWRGGGMAALYTRVSNRRRLAMEAMSKLPSPEQDQNISFPHLTIRCGRRQQNIELTQCFGNQDGAAKRTRTSTSFPTSTSS